MVRPPAAAAAGEGEETVPLRKRLRVGEPGAAEAPPVARCPPLERPVLRLREAGAEAPELRFEFRGTGPCSSLRADSAAAFRALLRDQAEHAQATQERWLRQPHARWIAEMVEELDGPARLSLARRHRQLQAVTIPEEDFVARWGETADFASSVVHLWFEGKSLADVLARAKALGHMEGDMASGHLLEGAFVEELAEGRDMSFGELLPMVQAMSGSSKSVSVYKIAPRNCFELELARRQAISKLRPQHGQGSLNTTWTYSESSRAGIGLMDEFHDAMTEALEGCDAVKLNPRLYMIWKFQHYVTSYHQDTHVPPHFTIYNQVSGVSLFHFLPLLVGLYVTHVGRRDVLRLEALLRELDAAGVGSLCTLGPGQAALITPFGSHGVWVPAVSHNPTLPPFSVSLIRATELYVALVLQESRQRHRRHRWNDVLPESAEAAEELAQFVAAQAELCREMGLSRRDWLGLARRTWAEWEAHSPGAAEDEGSEEEEEQEEGEAASRGGADA